MRRRCTTPASCCSRPASIPEAAERIRASIRLEPALGRRLVQPRAGARRGRSRRGRRQRAEGSREARTESPEILANLARRELDLGAHATKPRPRRGRRSPPIRHAAAWYNLALALQAAGPRARSARRREARRRRRARGAGATPASRRSSRWPSAMIGAGALDARRRARAPPASAALRFELAGLLERVATSTARWPPTRT